MNNEYNISLFAKTHTPFTTYFFLFIEIIQFVLIMLEIFLFIWMIDYNCICIPIVIFILSAYVIIVLPFAIASPICFKTHFLVSRIGNYNETQIIMF
jgi:hypothetical protein